MLKVRVRTRYIGAHGREVLSGYFGTREEAIAHTKETVEHIASAIKSEMSYLLVNTFIEQEVIHVKLVNPKLQYRNSRLVCMMFLEEKEFGTV